MPLAVTAREADPAAMTAFVVGAKVTLAPLEGAVKVTIPPSTGSPKALFTGTVREAAKAVLITVL